MNKQFIWLAALLVALPTIIKTTDNYHFYRTPFFEGEPRLEESWLASLDILLAGGSTRTSRNSGNNKTCLLNIYGTHNMHLVGEGVPNKDTTDPVDIALINLELVPSMGCFGNLLFKGRFKTIEFDALFTQNFTRGFFAQLHIPFRQLNITQIGFCDLTPTGNVEPNINTPEWQTFLNLFPDILAKYKVDIGPVHRRGIGDTTLFLGWTYNYQETEVLDYVDATIRSGVLIPTGKKSNPNKAFDLPLGYNGHIGIPVLFDGSFGAWDWLTMGTNLGSLVFLTKEQRLHMKTDPCQSGFIKLAQGTACVKPGTIWHITAYFKADHFFRGLSFLVGYSFTRQNSFRISPNDTCVFKYDIVNSDQQFKEWQQHVIHFMVDYDFTTDDMRVGPHISFFYDRQIRGKRVFNTSMGGGIFGIDIAWCL